jgi:hypothetical protein
MKDLRIGYVIEHCEYRDEHGIVKDSYYHIYKEKSFLGIFKYSSYIKHEECGWGDAYYTKTRFKTFDDAKNFISDILCKGIKVNGHTIKDIETIDCK